MSSIAIYKSLKSKFENRDDVSKRSARFTLRDTVKELVSMYPEQSSDETDAYTDDSSPDWDEGLFLVAELIHTIDDMGESEFLTLFEDVDAQREQARRNSGSNGPTTKDLVRDLASEVQDLAALNRRVFDELQSTD